MTDIDYVGIDVKRENAIALIQPAFEWVEENNPEYLNVKRVNFD